MKGAFYPLITGPALRHAGILPVILAVTVLHAVLSTILFVVPFVPDRGFAGVNPGVIGVNRRFISVNLGVIGINRRFISVNLGVIGISRGVISVSLGVIGINRRVIGVNRGVISVNRRVIGINRRVIGVSWRAVSVSRGSIRICPTSVMVILRFAAVILGFTVVIWDSPGIHTLKTRFRFAVSRLSKADLYAVKLHFPAVFPLGFPGVSRSRLNAPARPAGRTVFP